MTTPSEKPTSKYWICGHCADKKGWEHPKYAVTCISGICGYCEDEQEKILTPIVDFKRDGVEPVWD